MNLTPELQEMQRLIDERYERDKKYNPPKPKRKRKSTSTPASNRVKRPHVKKVHKRQTIVNKAFRSMVDTQIAEYKRLEFAKGPVICPVTGIELEFNKTTHCDHYKPQFAQLVLDYIKLRKLDYGTISILKEKRYGHSTWVLTDKIQIADWREYHYTRSDLRLVHESVNRRRVRIDNMYAELD